MYGGVMRMMEFQQHAYSCSSCNQTLCTLSDPAINAIVAGIKARHLQRTMQELGAQDNFLAHRHLKALLNEVILRKELSNDVLAKCDEVMAHFFSVAQNS